MTKNSKRLMVFVLLFTLLLSGASYSRTYSRSITAWFNNIQVILDGKTINLSNEPFIFENRVYMPIEELSDSLYMNYDYNDKEGIVTIDSNRLNISDPNSSAAPVTFQKEYELALVKYQNEKLQKELDLMKEGRYPYRRINTVSEMESYLKDHFSILEDINMTIQLVSSGKNKYTLNIVFDYFSISKWNVLGRRTIENYVDDLFYSIKDLFNSQAEIEGSIRHNSTYNNIKLVSYYTKGNRLFYDFTQAHLKSSQLVDGTKLEKELHDSIKQYNGISFTYEVFVSQGDIDLIIVTDSEFFKWSPSLKMNFLRRLKSEIMKVNPYIYVNGKIKDPLNVYQFSIEGDEIRSVDLLVEVEDFLNTNFKNFSYAENFSFTYSVSEGYSNNFKIDIQGNFSNNNSNWIALKNNAELPFRFFIQSAYQYVENIWDVDIFGELIDKDHNSICDLEFYPSNQYQYRSLQPIIFK